MCTALHCSALPYLDLLCIYRTPKLFIYRTPKPAIAASLRDKYIWPYNNKVFFSVYNSIILGNLQVQVATTQWILMVELHQFRNLYNAEVIGNHGFCCCDIEPTNNNYLQYCEEKAASLQGCSPSCDILLNAYVSHCIEPYPCSFYTTVWFDTASIDNFNDRFIFVLSSSPDEVRVWCSWNFDE